MYLVVVVLVTLRHLLRFDSRSRFNLLAMIQPRKEQSKAWDATRWNIQPTD